MFSHSLPPPALEPAAQILAGQVRAGGDHRLRAGTHLQPHNAGLRRDGEGGEQTRAERARQLLPSLRRGKW